MVRLQISRQAANLSGHCNGPSGARPSRDPSPPWCQLLLQERRLTENVAVCVGHLVQEPSVVRPKMANSQVPRKSGHIGSPAIDQ